MPTSTRLLLVAAPLAVALAAALLTLSVHAADKPAASAPVKPALTVTVTQPQPASVPVKIAANGNITAWQEASVGTEANGLRLAEVRVNVGDVVKRGQVLATFAADTMAAELAQTRAAVAEAEATLAEAAANAQRARELQTTGALSAQQINQYLTAERTAQARLEAQRAAAKTQQLRLAQTQVLAPDNGIISARSATVGAVLPAGQELFRLIRGGRLEWRAEVPAADLAQLKAGLPASVTPAGGTPIVGKLRMVAPTVDPATRNGIVYVDLPQPGAARAGMFARGEFEIGNAQRPDAAAERRGAARRLQLRAARRPRLQGGADQGEHRPPLGRPHRDHRRPGQERPRGRRRRRLPRRRRHRARRRRRRRRRRRPRPSKEPAMAINVSSWSIRNPTPSILLFVMLTLAGLMGFRAMKVQNFPDIDLPTVTVTASLPGASPAQLETEVARKIENSLATVQGLKHIYATVQDGTATLTAEFRLEKPTQEAVDDVRDAVSRVRSDLPADLRDPVIKKVDLAGTPILTYTVASQQMDDEALSWFVDNQVTKAMLTVRGVGAVSRVGGVTREVRVELDPARLLALNATAADISRQLRQVQQEASGGRADLGGAEQSVRTIATVQSAAGAGGAGSGAVRRPAHPPRPGRQGARHRGRAALGGAARRQAGGRLRDRALARRQRDRRHARRARHAATGSRPSTRTSASPRPSTSSTRWRRTSTAR